VKRSNRPIFWSLFGAGGMLAALVGPVLIFITGIAVPLGLLPRDTMSYGRVLAFAQSGLGKVAILALIGLFLFHGLHRIYHCLHELGLPLGHGGMALFHGLAAAGTLVAAYLVIAIG